MRAMTLAVFLAVPVFAASSPYGILLMAHGGDASWNAEIAGLRETVDAKVPTEIALGMADPRALQAAVDRLENRGVRRIAAVPLFVHTRSEVLDQTRYALGLTDTPSEVLRAATERYREEVPLPHAVGSRPTERLARSHTHVFSTERVKARVPVMMSPALDDHPLVARVLLERARGLSREPERETVVLVAHGPVDDAAMPAWRETLAALAAEVREAGGFKAAGYGVLRDDAAPAVRAAAVADLRATVAAAGLGGLAPGLGGRALVVPVLIARGGIERKVARDLAGLDYAWDGRTLLPHAGFGAWVLDRAAAAAVTEP